MEAVLRRATLLRHHLHAALQANPNSPSTSACQDASQAILTHQLLAGEQQFQQTSSHQHASAAQQHAQAVEAWCSALSQQLRKAQAAPAAAALLGTTAQACDADRLLQHYVAWGTSLADGLKKCCNAITQSSSTSAVPVSGGTAAMVVAAAGALCQLFGRLHDFLDVAGVRRDASSLATRTAGIITPMLAALDPADAGTTCASLLRLCATLLRTLPTAFRHHALPLERALVALVAAPSSSSSSSSSRGGSSALAELRACAVRCLCLLPRAPGEASAHSTTFRRLLLSLHDAMDGAFMGLDTATHTTTNTTTAATANVRELLRTGAPAPSVSHAPPVGHATSTTTSTSSSNAGDPLLPHDQLKQGAASSGGSGGAASGEGVRMQLDVLRALLVGLEALLVEPFPSPVPLPSAALLATLTRLLTFNDGAVLATGRVPPSSSGFARLSAGLPGLQAAGWCLLGLLLRVGGSSLLPLLPSIARLLADPLRRISVLGPSGLTALSPHVRCAVYSAAHAACEARGACAARLLADASTAAVTVELYGWSVQQQQSGQGGKFGGQAWGAGSRGGGSKQAAKRAKLAGAAEAVEGAEAAAAAAAAAAGATTCLAAGTPDLDAQLAALQLLETLARTGAPLLPPITRAQLDAVTFHVAASATAAAHRLSHGHPRTTASSAASAPTTTTATTAPSSQSGLVGGKGGAGTGGAASAAPGTVVAGVAALRAAALRALLASVLAPAAGQRPPFLVQALQLFRDAASSGRPEVASAAKDAELQLEAMLHPRALPITSAHPSASTYAGLQELAPLPRPRMWSVLDPIPTLMHPQSPAATAQPTTAQQGLASARAGVVAAGAGGASESGPSGLIAHNAVQSSSGREQQEANRAGGQPGTTAGAAGAVAVPAAVQQAREALDAERRAAAIRVPAQDGMLPDQGAGKADQARVQDGQGQQGAAAKAGGGRKGKGGRSEVQAGKGKDVDKGGSRVKRRADGSELPAVHGDGSRAVAGQGTQCGTGESAAGSDGGGLGRAGGAHSAQQQGQQQAMGDGEGDDEEEEQGVQSGGQQQVAAGGMPVRGSPMAAGVGAGQGESDDSEGPLPEIDSGGSGSDDDDESDEEMGS